METVRGRQYNEIYSVGGVPASKILAGYGEALPELSVSFDRHGRGTAVNVDLYGYDPSQDVAVVQIREFEREGSRRRQYTRIRKDYALVGRTESGGMFRHPVGAMAVRANASGDAAATVRAAQRWMFGVSEIQLARSVRQGDVLLTPERSSPKGEVTELGTGIVVGESHAVQASRIVRDGKGVVWALDPIIRHAKGQHAAICGDAVDQWHTVRLAKEAPTWSFTGGRLKD
ncbi:hypothetical protein [Magnetospirillum aberrantis]|uniref:Uncharacterized protein n=1 Tax=Magnetospirillum aberrantis SpK TaxID=908842 RepID=A0A7C9QSC4_9PROT|nr:hypothetical protein [Magnetospirillum aberrantis]NFV79001.1 hypothetical protein [Magnetospirillum aberrantis SpK]